MNKFFGKILDLDRGGRFIRDLEKLQILKYEMRGEIVMLTIGQLAECTGISEKALRFYENKGLIHSVRNKENNYRYYEGAEKETIEKIIMFKLHKRWILFFLKQKIM